MRHQRRQLVLLMIVIDCNEGEREREHYPDRDWPGRPDQRVQSSHCQRECMRDDNGEG